MNRTILTQVATVIETSDRMAPIHNKMIAAAMRAARDSAYVTINPDNRQISCACCGTYTSYKIEDIKDSTGDLLTVKLLSERFDELAQHEYNCSFIELEKALKAWEKQEG